MMDTTPILLIISVYINFILYFIAINMQKAFFNEESKISDLNISYSSLKHEMIEKKTEIEQLREELFLAKETCMILRGAYDAFTNKKTFLNEESKISDLNI